MWNSKYGDGSPDTAWVGQTVNPEPCDSGLLGDYVAGTVCGYSIIGRKFCRIRTCVSRTLIRIVTLAFSVVSVLLAGRLTVGPYNSRMRPGMDSAVVHLVGSLSGHYLRPISKWFPPPRSIYYYTLRDYYSSSLAAAFFRLLLGICGPLKVMFQPYRAGPRLYCSSSPPTVQQQITLCIWVYVDVS